MKMVICFAFCFAWMAQAMQVVAREKVKEEYLRRMHAHPTQVKWQQGVLLLKQHKADELKVVRNSKRR